MRAYRLYGLNLKSQWPLPCSEGTGPGLAEIELVEGPDSLFAAAARQFPDGANGTDWFHHARLQDGSDYLHYSGLFECVISSDGRHVAGRLLNSFQEVFQSHVLGGVMSYTLLKLGLEPLHGTGVVIDGGAVCFLGDSGYGKSTLGGAFLRRGHPLLTDDLLIVKDGHHGILAYPGHPRLKVRPEVARTLFPERVTDAFVNPHTNKFSISLTPPLAAQQAAPLRAFYVVRPATSRAERGDVAIRTLNQRRAFFALVANTFNSVVTAPDRQARLFALASRLAAEIPVKSLSYPRDLSRLPAVVEALLSDLTGGSWNGGGS